MERSELLTRIDATLARSPVVVLLGPRQSGKTTLARAYVSRLGDRFPAGTNYFDLEDPESLARLDAPKLALQGLTGLVVIDEVQRAPELFPLLRTLVDREGNQTRFLILGSASRDLIAQSSESLAGRISFLDVTPFTLPEVGEAHAERLWLRGGFPRSYLADSDELSVAWRDDFIRTFLERDIPALGIQIPPPAIRRFWMMIAHQHGQLFNASAIGRSLGISDTTASRYLDVLCGTFMTRRLTPWLENLGKRQVRRPKLYFRDAGILHRLLGVRDREQLLVHPRLGASWEGFALEEVIRLHQAPEEHAFFWAVHQQLELDLLLQIDGARLGFEFKYADAPRLRRSHGAVVDLLGLDSLTIVCPGEADYPLSDHVRVKGLEALVRAGV